MRMVEMSDDSFIPRPLEYVTIPILIVSELSRLKKMKALVIILLFAGMAIVLHSIYEERLKRAQKQVKVEYRFLPRTLYEEQMSNTDVMGQFQSMFSKSTPWYGTGEI